MNSLLEFKYGPDNRITFPPIFVDTRQFLRKDANNGLIKKKKLLLQKLGTKETTKYTNLILPKRPEEFSSEERKILSGNFGERDSLFHTLHKGLDLIKQENDDFVTYAGNVNSQCELFKLGDLSINMFKCLIFKPYTDRRKEHFSSPSDKTTEIYKK